MVLWLRLAPLLFLSGCGFRLPAGPSGYRHIDPKTGEEVVNALTIGADWMMYAGIFFVIGGLLAIVWKGKLLSGGVSVICGMSCFVAAQFLVFIGGHLLVFSIFFLSFLGVCGYLYVKAVTTGLPWLEKLFKIDFNNDGHIGTLVHRRTEDAEELSDLENPENV